MRKAHLNPAPIRVITPLHLTPSQPAALKAVLTGQTMGTSWSLTLQHSSAQQSQLVELRSVIDNTLERINTQMSHWREDSTLAAYGRAPANSWVSIPLEFHRVMHCALQLATRSHGAFDPTIAPLVNLWGFGPGQRYRDTNFVPPDELKREMAQFGWQQLQLKPLALWQPGGFALDLSGIAKGYAVDALAEQLQARGFTDFLVEVGGELRADGMHTPLDPWWVEVCAPAASPSQPTTTLCTTRIALHQGAIATSGDTHHHFYHRGQKYAHTIDPRTRAPVAAAMSQVVVLHQQAMWADAWASALTVLGVEDGMTLATQEGLAVLMQWQTPEGQWHEALSPQMQQRCATADCA